MSNDIAIVGMAGCFPEASNIAEYWSNVKKGRCSISDFSNDELAGLGVPENLLKNKLYIKAKGWLKNADCFDAGFFNFSQHDAQLLDPQYRLLLSVVWQAFENSAYIPSTYPGKVGIFVGSSNIDSYSTTRNLLNYDESILTANNFSVMLHNAKDFLATLIAYKLNLRGPAINIQTACSTSLVAVHTGCQSLLSGDSDLVVAGATCVSTPLKSGYLFQEGLMLSPTGKCSTFDERANGIVVGNASAAIILKRYTDAVRDCDHIHAIIKGSAVNCDGNNRIGFTAPAVTGQTQVIEQALNNAQLSPTEISYIETHGTGTILGDLIEIESLKSVFKSKNVKARKVVLGTSKPNIGHTDVVSGVAGLIKTVEALKEKVLPPAIHFTNASKQLNLDQTNFEVNTKLKSWMPKQAVRYAGVSSFGMGGTNAHVILQEAPKANDVSIPPISSLNYLLLSAKSVTSLNNMIQELAEFLITRQDMKLSEIAYSLQVGRQSFQHRVAFECESVADAIAQCENPSKLENSFSSGVVQDWLGGKEIDWKDLYKDLMIQRVPLPGYHFEKVKYWACHEALQFPKFKSVSTSESSTKRQKKINVAKIKIIVQGVFEEFLSLENPNIEDSFEVLGGDSLTALLITHELNKLLNLKLPFSIFDNNLSILTLSRSIMLHIENQ